MTDQSLLPLMETIPADNEREVVKAITAAVVEDTPIYTIGGGTALSYGGRPTAPGLGLLTSGMNGVVDYPSRDMTITVEAGMTLRELSDRLAAEHQRLPMDVAFPDRATIGGAIAANTSGPRRFGCGTLRDYLLGFRAVDGSAEVFSAGGRVVKNAAGYDLCKLMVGSFGTLGVLTQVTLMVRPLAETSAAVACALHDLGRAESLLVELAAAPLTPVMVELLAGPAWRDDAALGSLARQNEAWLLVGLEASRVEVDWMVQQLDQLWRSKGLPLVVLRDADAAALRRRLVEFPARSQAVEDNDLIVSFHLRPSAVVPTVAGLRRLDSTVSIESHAANGVVNAAFCRPDARRIVGHLNQVLRPLASRMGGHLVVRSSPLAASLSAGDVWGPPPAEIGVMRAIKRSFDPQGVLNPGRTLLDAESPTADGASTQPANPVAMRQ